MASYFGTNIKGKFGRINISDKAYEKLWTPFLDVQPKTGNPELQIYRDAVDEMSDHIPLEAISPVRMADYARYRTLYEKLSDEGYNYCGVGDDQEDAKYYICQKYNDIASDLLLLAKAEGRLYMEEAKATAESE